MKKNSTIQIKAAFLLMVFAFNIVVGFACSMGIKLNFAKSHHDKKTNIAKIHVHADGKKHQHGAESTTHTPSGKDNHDDAGCCTDGVVKLAQSDKAIPEVTNLANPIVTTIFIAAFYYTDIFYNSQVIESIKYFVRGHHPPIPDIRIAIRSFQI